MKTWLAALAAVAILAAAAQPAAAQGFDIRTHTLKNGMKILVQEDHSIPNVALYIFYRVGSRNERPGITGISHFFEHMMFNGAKKYGPGEFDRVMEGNGGSNNAYTSQNVTVYQDWFPRSALERIFDLEADRIQHLSFDPEIVESERGVIASERRNGVDANNAGLLNEQLWAAAFTAHPYQWPVVGWMSDIEAWTLDDLKNHFKMGYSPSNATMVVSGDVTFDEIVALAQKYIEPIPVEPAAARREDDGAGAAGRAADRGAQVRAAADSPDRLSRARDVARGLLRPAGARDHPVLRPEFPHVQAPRGQGPARAVGGRRFATSRSTRRCSRSRRSRRPASTRRRSRRRSTRNSTG